MLKILSVSLFAFFLSNSAQAKSLDPYYQIKSVSVQEEAVNQELYQVVRAEALQLRAQRLQDGGLEDILNPVKEVEKIVDTIINIGAKVWSVFEKSTPVVNLSTKRANALPREVTSWRDMANWSDIEARQYSVSYKNGFNATVVRFSILMTYSYNGSFQGRGQYLSDVGFLVNDYWVAPLYTLEGESEVVRVLNVGRDDAPIAAMELNMVWRVNNVLFKSQRAINYFIRGDGQLKLRELQL